MPEFWHKGKRRGQETLAFWKKYLPLMTVGGTTPDQHAADLDRLEPLVQARDDRSVDVQAAKHRVREQLRQIRALNLAVPMLIAGSFEEADPIRQSLARVQQIVPRTRALNLERARVLIPVWQAANAALASRPPGEAIVRDTVGVTEFAGLVAGYPALGQGVDNAAADLSQARSALRAHHRHVDRMNKRAYLKFKAEAYTNEVLRTALLAAITREKTSGSRRRKEK